ncbi:L,D-transpeptidase family protein [Streptomyces cucumeris]|uniref:L,D-transpeptidase family protein n=1 Tax=Streptomyces cucumeris TaxID=2962890 RepID=UPI003EC15016
MRVRTRTGRRAAGALTAAALLLSALSLTGCEADGGHRGSSGRPGAPDGLTDGAPSGREPASAHHPGRGGPVRPAARPDPAPELFRELPGLGPRTREELPDDSGQVLVVTGTGHDSSRSTVVLYERVAADKKNHRTRSGTGDAGAAWRAGASWMAHNGLRGWTERHHQGDLRSPIGVFGLTGSGGRRKDPGTLLPYDHAPRAFTIHGSGSEGEPLSGSFGYVVAIDYNRRSGTSPLDPVRPMGGHRGGGIWLHVDHGGPTQGCVSLSRKNMKSLLLTLDPRRRPVVVMGDSASLAR